MGQDAPRTPRTPRRRSDSDSDAPAPRRRSVLPRAFGLFTVACLGLAAGYVGYVYKNSNFFKIYGHSLLHPKTVQDEFPGRNYINLMVIGRDYDYSDQDQILKNQHTRSDLLMVGHIDFDKGGVSLLSIPRDTKANIPGWGIGKINAAHSHGGPQLSEAAVKSNFGIPSDNYVALDFAGFEQAIDILDGVDVKVDRKMDYDDNWGHLHIHLLPGMQHLNGQQAMGFVRFRHADSDFVRVQRQQALLAALKEKLHDPRILAKLPALLDTIDKHVESDMTADQKVAIARFIQGVPRDQIRMDTLPSKEGSGTFVETDWAKAEPLIQSIFAVGPPEGVVEADEPAAHHRHHHHHRQSRLAELP